MGGEVVKPSAQEEWSEPTAARARELLGAMLGRRVLVIGDSALDAYVAGEVERISPEAPVPVLAVEREDYLLGGAANVAKCLVALGARTTLCTVFGAAGARPVLVDPKNLPWKAFGGATLLKPNLRAAEAYAHAAIEDEAGAKRVAARIAEELGVAHVLLTRGAEGMVLASRGSNATLGIAARAKELVDETGAGDVVAAAGALALAAGAELGEAARLANVAAGVKGGKFGAPTGTRREVASEVRGGPARAGGG